MNEKREKLYNKIQTGYMMYWLVENFAADLTKISDSRGNKLSTLSIEEFFNFVKNIPYKMDVKPIEIIARPKYLISKRFNGLDCKKKAVLMGCWCKLNGVVFRFVTSSKRADKKIHHVFCQGQINNTWVNLDCTYNIYSIGDSKEVTNWEILKNAA